MWAECLSVCVFMCMCAYLPVQTCVCVSVSFIWGLWSRRLPQPGVTFSHEGVTYDTSSGLGQTLPDPSSNTPAWSLPSPVFPFCTPTAATLPPPLPFSPRWTFSLHPTLLSAPCLPAPATAGLNLQLIGTFALFGCGWVTREQGQLLWPEKVVSQTEMWHKQSAHFRFYCAL